MPWATAVPVIIWAVLFVPLTIWFFLKVPKYKILGLVLFLDYVAFNLFWMLTVNWAFVNYYLRFLPILTGLVILVRWAAQYFRYRTPFFPKKNLPAWLSLAAALLFLGAASAVNSRAHIAQRYESFKGKPMLALYPLRLGIYVIVNGGDAIDGLWLSNYLKDWLGRDTGNDRSLAYALDMVELYNETGRFSEKSKPKIAAEYAMFNEPVYSPCFGDVVYVEDGHPDVTPFSPGHGIGNYVVIKCAEYFVTLGNFKNGSIYVKNSDTVSMQNILGYIGNSADPGIPHLHMHVTTGGWGPESNPVPVQFDTSTYEFASRARNHIFIR